MCVGDGESRVCVVGVVIVMRGSGSGECHVWVGGVVKVMCGLGEW